MSPAPNMEDGGGSADSTKDDLDNEMFGIRDVWASNLEQEFKAICRSEKIASLVLRLSYDNQYPNSNDLLRYILVQQIIML